MERTIELLILSQNREGYILSQLIFLLQDLILKFFCMRRDCIIDKIPRINPEEFCITKQPVLRYAMLDILDERVGAFGQVEL